MSINYSVSGKEEMNLLLAFLSDPMIDDQFIKKLSQREISIKDRIDYIFDNGFWILAKSLESAVIGCIGIKRLKNGKAEQASTLAVHPDYKDQGLGFGLGLTSIAKSVEIYQVDTYYADSWKGNKKMATLLLSNGFEIHTEFNDSSKRPPDMKTIVYRKDLKEIGNQKDCRKNQIIQSIWQDQKAPLPVID